MKTFLRATVGEFFRQRAGTFFVLMGMLFGFLGAAEHHAFAVFFLTGSNGLVYLFLIWLLYTSLCIQFVMQLLKNPAYTFIYQARLWPLQLRLSRFSALALGLLQPILFYGIYLIVISSQEKVLNRFWPVLPFYGFLVAGIVIAVEWRIKNPAFYTARNQNAIFKWPFKRPVSTLYWCFEWLFRERGVTLLVGKLGAILVAVCTILNYDTERYDLRLPAVGLSLAYLLNLGLSLEFFKWETSTFLWFRSMPFSKSRKFRAILTFHAILILPETFAAIRNGSLAIFEIIQLYALGTGILTLVHLLLYKMNGLPENSLTTYLFGFIGLTLLIMYKIPILLIAGTLLVFSYYFYPKWYRI